MDNNKYAKVDRGKTMRLQSYKNKYRQINIDESKNSVLKGRVYQLILQYLVANPKNINTSDIILSE